MYWLLTGSTKIGTGGTVSNLGALIWLAPLIFGCLVLVVGDRGVFRWFFDVRATVAIGPDGLAWSSPSSTRRVEWSDLGGVSRVVVSRRNTQETVFDGMGTELVMLRGPFVISGTRRTIALPSVIVVAQPDLFASLDAQHPEWGCVRRDRLGLPSAVRDG